MVNRATKIDMSICELMELLQGSVRENKNFDAIMIAKAIKRRLAGGIGDVPLDELATYTIPRSVKRSSSCPRSPHITRQRSRK